MQVQTPSGVVREYGEKRRSTCVTVGALSGFYFPSSVRSVHTADAISKADAQEEVSQKSLPGGVEDNSAKVGGTKTNVQLC